MAREGLDLYPVVKGVLRPAVRAFWKPTVVGMENVPASGPALRSAFWKPATG